MEVLSPSPPPSPCASSLNDQLRLRPRCGGGGGRREQQRGEAWVHVAAGRSPEKTLGLLRWAIRRLGCRRVALLHVHQPSPVIPTLLGKIPAAQATEELVLSHRKSEKEEMSKILLGYLAFCHRSQVQATLLVTENDQVHDGILMLVNHYGITRLVMGSAPDNCFKLKASHGKEYLIARNAPAFCQIWFVWRGRHIWTREATADANRVIPFHNQDDVMTTKRIRFSSHGSNNAEAILDGGYIACEALAMVDLNRRAVSSYDRSSDSEAPGAHEGNHFHRMSMANLQDAESTLDSTLQRNPKEILDTNLKQAMMEADGSRNEAFVELLKRKETESKVASSFARAKDFESAKEHEMKTREGLEVLLAATRKQREDLLMNKDKAATELDSSLRRLSILDARAKMMNLRVDEFAAELEVIQSSIKTLRRKNTCKS